MYGRGHTTAALVLCLTITAQLTAAFVHILVIVVDTITFLALERLYEDKLCDILQAIEPTHVETIHQIFLIHIESNLDR